MALALRRKLKPTNVSSELRYGKSADEGSRLLRKGLRR